MADALVQWFTSNLSGMISKEGIIFIISMIPILELRGCIPGPFKCSHPYGYPPLYHRKHSPHPIYSPVNQQDSGVDGDCKAVSSPCSVAEAKSHGEKSTD